MENLKLILVVVVFCLITLGAIFFFISRKNKSKSISLEAIERMLIRDYGSKINDKTRSNIKKK